MKTAIAILLSLGLVACGGGGDNSTSPPVNKIQTISFYGKPLTSTTAQASAHAAVAHLDVASAPTATSDVPATPVLVSLTDALAAKGVTATVTPQILTATTLHALIIGTDAGLPPTPDQFKLDPSEWMIVNFELDDMTLDANDPVQQAASTQFRADLDIFIQRAFVAGKQPFIVLPFPTCDRPVGSTSADSLVDAELQVGGGRAFPVGAYSNIIALPDWKTRMGADCRTPDADLINMRTNAVADQMAARFALAQAGK